MAGLLGKFISLVFGKKGYQEAFPFPSGTGSGSFRNIKITETSKSIAWKQVVCFTCTPFQVNWITCLCRRTYLQKWYKVINFNHMSGTVLQCIYYKVGEREIVWISLPLKREGKFVLPCIIPVGRYSLSTPGIPRTYFATFDKRGKAFSYTAHQGRTWVFSFFLGILCTHTGTLNMDTGLTWQDNTLHRTKIWTAIHSSQPK